MFPLIVFLVLIRELKHIAVVAMVANVIYTVGFAIIFVDVLHGLPPVSSRSAVTSTFSTLPLFFGTVMFAFEGVNLVSINCFFQKNFKF